MSLESIKPSDDIETLKIQFRALKSFAIAQQEQLRYYQNEQLVERLARNQLDSERLANAILTAEVEKLKALLAVKEFSK